MVFHLIHTRESDVNGKSATHICLLLSTAMAATGCNRFENAYKCRSGDPDTRIAACTALIQAGPPRPTPAYLSLFYNNRGMAYTRKKQYDLALPDFNEAIRLNPKNAAAYLDRGDEYNYAKDYDHAIDDLNQAIRLSPKNATAYHYRGNAFGGRGLADDEKDDYSHASQDYTQAIQDYTDAIQRNPFYAYAYYGRGLAYDRRGLEHDNADDYDHALQDYSEAIRLGVKNAGAYAYRGLAFSQKGEYDRGIQDADQAIRLNPRDAFAYIERGGAYLRKGEPDQAIQDFSVAVRINPKDTGVYLARGDAYLLQSNFAAAASDFESVISVAPSSRAALYAALMLHVAMKRLGRDDSRQLAQVAAATDMSKWPGPVLKLDMGKTTAADVLVAAANPGDERRMWHVCQANYFTGEDALLHHQRATALIRLQTARDRCPRWDADYAEAMAELKTLGVPSTPFQ
jgi:tetratricopeptide (TPR) repeat protein